VPAMIKQNGLPTAVNPNEMFNLQEPDWAMFEKFSDHLKKKIISSPEFEKAKGGAQPAQPAPSTSDSSFNDDDIPF
jgi:hypothetical protein